MTRTQTVNTRIDPLVAAPALMKSWFSASLQIASSLEPRLAALVEIRASQINGCANCINMHTVYARAEGETEQRIYLLSAWREAPCYTDRERAALGWTEALTRLSEEHDDGTAYEELKAHFTEEEQVKLTLMIMVINGWNRLAVGLGGFVDPADVKARAAAACSQTEQRSMLRRRFRRCVRRSCALRIACSARWPTPRTSCRKPISAG